MEILNEEYNVAAAAMRLQTPYLHEVHREILDHLTQQHEKVVILLGIAPILNSITNPLTFQQRRDMLQESYPDIIVLKDVAVPSDELWSKNLDKEIKSILTPNDTVILYGGRDSCLPHYTGKFPTRELVSSTVVSSTEIRRKISKGGINSSDFRAGVVWATANRYPTCFPTVDVAIFNDDYSKILLARKEYETKFRLVGGFADPTSISLEADARREVQEETGLEITEPKYVASRLINDWRYAKEKDAIKTTVFKAQLFYGSPKPMDDIVECRWFDLDKLQLKRDVVITHHEILTLVLESL